MSCFELVRILVEKLPILGNFGKWVGGWHRISTHVPCRANINHLLRTGTGRDRARGGRGFLESETAETECPSCSPGQVWMGVGRLVRHRESLRGHFMRTFQQFRGNLVQLRRTLVATSSQICGFRRSRPPAFFRNVNSVGKQFGHGTQKARNPQKIG